MIESKTSEPHDFLDLLRKIEQSQTSEQQPLIDHIAEVPQSVYSPSPRPLSPIRDDADTCALSQSSTVSLNCPVNPHSPSDSLPLLNPFFNPSLPSSHPFSPEFSQGDAVVATQSFGVPPTPPGRSYFPSSYIGALSPSSIPSADLMLSKSSRPGGLLSALRNQVHSESSPVSESLNPSQVINLDSLSDESSDPNKVKILPAYNFAQNNGNSSSNTPPIPSPPSTPIVIQDENPINLPSPSPTPTLPGSKDPSQIPVPPLEVSEIQFLDNLDADKNLTEVDQLAQGTQ